MKVIWAKAMISPATAGPIIWAVLKSTELTPTEAAKSSLGTRLGLPIMVLLPFAGAAADRYDRLRLARLLQSLPMGFAAILAVLVWFDWINVPLLFILTMLNGAAEGMWVPVRLTIAPNLVPKGDFAASVGVNRDPVISQTTPMRCAQAPTWETQPKAE